MKMVTLLNTLRYHFYDIFKVITFMCIGSIFESFVAVYFFICFLNAGLQL